MRSVFAVCCCENCFSLSDFQVDTKELIEHHLERLEQRRRASEDEAEGEERLLGEAPRRKERIGIVVDGRTLAYCLRSRVTAASAANPPPLPPPPVATAAVAQREAAGVPSDYALRKQIEDKFVQLISRCTSVLCCRATPSQKVTDLCRSCLRFVRCFLCETNSVRVQSHIVRLVKTQLQGKTLAIGDGANDVAMIQSADVGVGISGQEGMQAVMASDFALARFCFLKRLLFVHGHWCYDRLARTILYFFYKNAVGCRFGWNLSEHVFRAS